MKKVILTLIGFLFIMGCTSTITTRNVTQVIPTNKKAEDKKIMDTVNYVLIENGFEIKNINETFGLITTEWREIKDSGDTTANVLGAIAVGLGGGSYTKYSRKMMVQVKIKKEGYQIIPKLVKEAKTNTTFKSNSDKNIFYPDKESNEGKLVIKILKEINGYLEIKNNYEWNEKTITVG